MNEVVVLARERLAAGVSILLTPRVWGLRAAFGNVDAGPGFSS